MFPNQDASLTESDTSTIGVGVILSYDFDVGEFNMKDGKIIELTGLEALKMWIKKVLLTQKLTFKIYTQSGSTYSYGVTIMEFVNSGMPFNYIKSELQKEITDALLKNNYINSLSDFSFVRIDSKLTISFTVNSTYGASSEEVTYNV